MAQVEPFSSLELTGAVSGDSLVDVHSPVSSWLCGNTKECGRGIFKARLQNTEFAQRKCSKETLLHEERKQNMIINEQ